MTRQQILKDELTFATGNIRGPNYPCMRKILYEHEFTKVGINRNENPYFSDCPFEQHSIAWIRSELTRLDHVMALIAKPVSEETAGATVY